MEDPQNPEEYTDDISGDEIDEILRRAKAAESKSVELGMALSAVQQTERTDQNFLHHQISTDEMLEKLEHFYRGDVSTYDPETGDTDWHPQTNKDLVTFNEYGVTSFMEIVTKYIDRNTILSNYSPERIFEIIGSLGDELVLFLLCNYEKLGMDTYFKKTKFRLLIITTLNIIESTYNRSLRGKTMEELNQAKVVGQFANSPQHYPTPQKQPGRISRFFGNR